MSPPPAPPPASPPASPQPPIAPWGRLMLDPRCTLTVGAPGAAVVAVLAEELRRRRLRVKVDPSRQFLYAKPLWPLVTNILGIVTLTETGLSTPSLRARVIEDRPGGSSVLVWTRDVGLASGAGGRFRAALNATAARFAGSGAPFSASPWERTPATWNWREMFEDMV